MAQIIAPATLSFIIPAAVIAVDAKLPYMERLFVALGVVLALVSVVAFITRDIDIAASFGSGGQGSAVRGAIWSHSRVMLGFVTIFLILGVEAGLFGFYRNFLEDPGVGRMTAHQSQLLFTVYFAVFAFGRLAASWVQTKMLPTTHLIISLAGAMACLATAVLAKGMFAVAAVTAIGFFVSVLFPTLYSLAIENMGELTGQASGLLTMGFVGCALIPVLQGKLADSIGLQHSYALGLASYLFAMFYTFKMRQAASLSPVCGGTGN